MKTKECSRCRDELDVSEFHKNRSQKDGLSHYCKLCRSRRLRDNPPSDSQKAAKSEYDRQRYVEHERYRRAKERYGLSKAEYLELVETKSDCEICGREFSEDNNETKCIDHDHGTGDIRGVLCRQCNLMLGCARDSKDILWRAIQYLDEE